MKFKINKKSLKKFAFKTKIIIKKLPLPTREVPFCFEPLKIQKRHAKNKGKNLPIILVQKYLEK